jgi:Flp pilus assembly protein TadG
MDRQTLFSRLIDKKGTISVSVAVLFFTFIAFAAFAIDVGYMMVRRNELQNIADTAALSAAGKLGDNYSSMTYIDAIGYTPSPGPLLVVAQSVASGTGVSGVTIGSTDFQLGVWTPSTHTFTPQAVQPTAVRVTAHKDNTENGPFSTFLAGVLGIDAFNVSAMATASLTPLFKANPGTLPIPVGISYAWYNPDNWPDGYCNQPIKFYPTGGGDLTGCAGWHVYDQSPASANVLRQTINGLNNGTYSSPETTAGVTEYHFTGGNLANVFSNNNFTSLQTLFNTNKVQDTDGRCEAALAQPQFAQYGVPYGGSSWTTAVAVYAPAAPTIAQSLAEADCSNPNGDMLIVGFSTITICAVAGPPQYSTKLIMAIVDCNSMSSGPGGGPVDTGLTGTLPNLVQ